MKTSTICWNILLFLLLNLLLLNVAQSLQLSKMYSSNMVLQRDSKRTQIWGYSNSSSVNLKVVFQNSTQNLVVATKDGKFEFPLEHSAGGPYSLIFSEDPLDEKEGKRVSIMSGLYLQLDNVYFGDVFLCSGQSNMEQPVIQTFNATEEINDSDKFPLIRHYTVPKRISDKPLEDVMEGGNWHVTNKETIGKFSAVCYYFGKSLAQRFPTLPIGLITPVWSGTYIEAWMSVNSLLECQNQSTSSIDKMEKDQPNPNQPSVLFNGMIFGIIRYDVKAFFVVSRRK